jgi:hypothetical protein
MGTSPGSEATNPGRSAIGLEDEDACFPDPCAEFTLYISVQTMGESCRGRHELLGRTSLKILEAHKRE